MNRRRSPRYKTALLAVFALALCVVPVLLAAPTKAVHPPKTAKIVEGLSFGDVRIGSTTYTDLVTAWGKAECHLNSDDSTTCSWFAPHAGGLINQYGTLEVSLAPGATGKVSGLRISDLKDNPRYRWLPVLTGWKTARRIGLRSTLAAVEKAYGSKLHFVPNEAHISKPPPPNYPIWAYLETPRGAQRLATSFYFSRTPDGRGPMTVKSLSIEGFAAWAKEFQWWQPAA